MLKHFYQNIEGWFDYEFLYDYVVKLFGDGSHFVEVGTFKGKSAAYLATEIINSGKRIDLYCVDTWEVQAGNSVQTDYSFDEFNKNIEPVKSVIIPKRLPSIEAAKLYADNSLDFVFIDANHDFDSVAADINEWLPKIKPGGIIAGHDYSGYWPGVVEAVKYKFKSDFTNVGSCWIHVKSTEEKCLSKFNVYSLVLNDERRKQITSELSKFNVSWTDIQCVLVSDLTTENPNVWQANSRSFFKAFNQHLESGSEKPLLILEDDVIFTSCPDSFIDTAFNELPKNWDALYIGANIQAPCVSHSLHLDRCNGAWCTHSVIFSKKCIEKILKEFNPDESLPLDEWLRRNSNKLNLFITNPTFATQRSGFSFMQGIEINYECIFLSQKYLSK